MYELSDVCLQPVPLNQAAPQITLLGLGLRWLFAWLLCSQIGLVFLF